ncbi:MAG: hypothetical protein L3J74_15730 [Bacteroidales bacterium]|nr:hypothetical protein [Bacteroidales bacterium]
MKTTLFSLLVFLSVSLTAQENNKSLPKVNWNGYAQLRVSSNFNDYSSVMLRRLKFWIKSNPEFSEKWYYKVQVLFTSWMQEKFFLQDAKVVYKTEMFSLDIGQFIPAYSLQWTQPDYLISSIERAIAVNALHPNGSLGVRDIGGQLDFHTENKVIETHLGIFNGYGIKEYRFNNKGYMITHKTAFNIHFDSGKLQMGYSLQYRKAEQLKIPHVLPDSVLFSGSDFRYNLFAMYQSKILEIQAEFLNANFDGEQASGYYILSGLNINEKNQIVLGYENYSDLISSTDDLPYCRIGYNYYINDYKIKLSVDNYFQINQETIEKYYIGIQLQMFFK